MEPGDWIALATLILVPVGFVVTVLLYRRERGNEKKRDREAALSVLRAVRDGIMPWGEMYFCKGYDDAAAHKRAQEDYESIMKHTSYGEVFCVPTAPLVALLGHPAAGGLIRRETVEAASVALWQIGIFNQLVRQKSDFNAEHLPEIRNQNLPAQRRTALADAAYTQSHMLHLRGIGDARWWTNLKQQLQANIEALLEKD